MTPPIGEIHAAASPAELWRIVRSYYRALGFRGFAYLAVSRGKAGTIRGYNIFHRGFPRRIEQVYVQEGLGEIDPAPAYVLSKGIAMRWTEIWGKVEQSPEIDYYLERMREAGVGDGYTLPVFGPSGRNACIALGQPVDPSVFDSAPVGEMHVVAQAAHMRLCHLLPIPSVLEKPLSARELEILDWVARGKSNSVIAEILDLSGATVDTYLRRIYDKLDVSDRTSAAVRGVGMGLIAA